MSRKVWHRTALCVSCLAAGLLTAKDVEWTGAGNANWDTSTFNWKIGDTDAVFAEGDNVFFGDESMRKTVTVSTAKAGKIVFSNDTDYVLDGGGSFGNTALGIQEASRFEKYGEGKLTVTGFHSFTGDVLIAEGTIETTPDSDALNAGFSALGNPRAERVITVLSEGILSFYGNGGTGSGTSTAPLMELRVLGGTLNLQRNFCTTLGNVFLDDATVTYENGKDTSWRTLLLLGDWIRFRGTRAYVFPCNGTYSGISMGRYKPVEIDVSDITTNDDSDVVFQFPFTRVNLPSHNNPAWITPGHFVKTGAGTLELASADNTFTGDVRVVEGTLRCSGKHAHIGEDVSGLGSPRYPHHVYVGTNTTLHFMCSDIQGQVYNDSRISIHVDGGTLKTEPNTANCFGPVVFENATLSYSGHSWGSGVEWPVYAFNDSVTFKGTNTYTLACINSSWLFFGSTRPADVIVDDITGNGTADVTIDMPIRDGNPWFAYGADGFVSQTNAVGRPSQFHKKGRGTLVLKSVNSTFSGNVEISEGTLEIPTGNNLYRNYSALGNPWVPGRRITVRSGGELRLSVSDIVGQLSTSNNLTIVVSNGTLRSGASTCNAFGNLDFYDAKFIYQSGTVGARHWGVGGFGAKFRLDGTVPYDFADTGKNCWFSLGYANDFVKVNEWLYLGNTEWDVRDITGDGGVDVTFRPVLQDIPNWDSRKVDGLHVNFSCGLKKTGPGTLRLTGENIYTGTTEVVSGTLLIDSASSASAVTVKNGGRLGGSGVVPSVTIEAGGGFEVSPDLTKAMRIAKLDAAAGGVIHVLNPSNQPCETLNVAFARVDAFVTDFDSGRWTVLMDGAESTVNLNVTNKKGVLTARWMPGGTVILFR